MDYFYFGEIFLNFHKSCLNIIETEFRTLFKTNPSVMPFYSFYKDEWNRVSYFDYNGAFLEQSPNTWLLLFR